MADNAGSNPKSAEQPKPQGNAAFRALGLPNIKWKLPSRNWLIFISVTGAWTSAYFYDRRQSKNIQKKWCTLVAPLAQEPLPTNTLPRRITIFLAAPPGDGLRSAREHFVEYIKPVLVAGALSWDVVEGRREGEIRAGLAERVRRIRRKHGETSNTAPPEDLQAALEACRQRAGVQELEGIGGELVIGRHTWKEYVRGLHEGWLGPMDEPISPPPQKSDSPSDATPAEADIPATPDPELMATPAAEPLPISEPTDASPTAPKEKTKEEDPPAPPKPLVTLPYNTLHSYAESRLPPSIPADLGPSVPIAFPHILGFFNTPIRMYRFLTQRHLADDVGRQTAATVLATYRPFREPSASASMAESETKNQWEQEALLEHEESSWHKSARDRSKDEEGKEREWLDDMVLDQRIAERMRLFEVTSEDEERARRIGQGGAGIPGHVKEERSDYGED